MTLPAGTTVSTTTAAPPPSTGGTPGAGVAINVTPPAAPQAPTQQTQGFPPNVRVDDMTADQQAAYWKDKARKHEERVKTLGVTPEELAELRTKAQRTDDLDYELSSDREKAVADATKAASEAAEAKYRPMVVKAEFRAAAAGRIDEATLTSILEPLNLTAFTSKDGTPDTAKVKEYVDRITQPAKGTAQPRLGPSSTGLGHQAPVATNPGDAGRAAAEKRFPKKSQ